MLLLSEKALLQWAHLNGFSPAHRKLKIKEVKNEVI